MDRFAPRNPHVWVRPMHQPTEHRGFLVAWLKDGGVWVGAEVLYLDPKTGTEVRVEVPRDRVRPADGAPFTGSAYG